MPGQEIQDNPIRIEFYGRNSANPDSYLSNEIYAKVDGYEYKIDLDPDECYTVQNQQDFDNDGVKDALICHVQACGGNAAGDSYFFIKYNGTGYFSISNEFGNNVWEEPLIENWNGQPSVVIIDTNTGFNTDSKLTLKERYILKQGNAVRVESSKKQAIRAIQEIRNSDFHNGKEEEYIHMTYDLNEDGKDESISCHYWDRWDALLFDIAIDGFIYECNTGYTRIGILESTTNGYHDLIAGDDDIFKWDGTQYKSGEVTINRQK
ncbi:MAG: hypothetical protein LIP00_09540 [Parabacteroides sp.]|nr:hypothetical protein [Parabacteroides sp.]